MCFKTPEIPKAPPVPDRNAEEARRRRTQQDEAARLQQGRAATILTSPLGDPNYGANVRRTTISGV